MAVSTGMSVQVIDQTGRLRTSHSTSARRGWYPPPMAKTFFVLDGHYQIYRSFYGLPQRLTSPTGEPTGATHVFGQMLFNLLRERKPDYLAMAMDVSDETVFRCDVDPAYKSQSRARAGRSACTGGSDRQDCYGARDPDPAHGWGSRRTTVMATC